MTKPNTSTVGPVDMLYIDRLPGSRNGNPRYLIVTADHGTFKTAPDSSIAYGLPNYFGRDHLFNQAATRRDVTLHLDGRGNVFNVTGSES